MWFDGRPISWPKARVLTSLGKMRQRHQQASEDVSSKAPFFPGPLWSLASTSASVCALEMSAARTWLLKTGWWGVRGGWGGGRCAWLVFALGRGWGGRQATKPKHNTTQTKHTLNQHTNRLLCFKGNQQDNHPLSPVVGHCPFLATYFHMCHGYHSLHGLCS